MYESLQLFSWIDCFLEETVSSRSIYLSPALSKLHPDYPKTRGVQVSSTVNSETMTHTWFGNYRARLKAGLQVWWILFLLLLITSAWLACSIHATWGPPFSRALYSYGVVKPAFPRPNVRDSNRPSLDRSLNTFLAPWLGAIRPLVGQKSSLECSNGGHDICG